ncbi:MAG TPA: DUF2975 domain-containing protein [Firmicutes bacterium]|nr:DUF2975 domain-containing protein [Bacillota bacterium]
MRYLGKNSISSFLRIACNIAWYFNLILGGILLLGLFFFAIHGSEILPQLMKDFSFQAPGLKFFIDLRMVTVRPLPRVTIVAVFGSAICFIAVSLFILYQLRKIFSNLVKEEPFVKENVLRVRKIGVIVLVGAVLQSIVEYLIGYFVVQHVMIQGMRLVPDFGLNFPALLAGLSVLVLAEVLKEGTEIKEDQNLTI